MERPTCKTCPYWEHVEDPDDDSRPVGICHRSPPQYTGTMESDDSLKSVSLDAWDQPWIAESGWCGEHLDFPAYLAAIRLGGNDELGLQPERRVRISELAERIGYGVGTVRGWARCGYIPSERFKNIYYFNIDEVRSVLEARKRLGSFPKELEHELWKQATAADWNGWGITSEGEIVRTKPRRT